MSTPERFIDGIGNLAVQGAEGVELSFSAMRLKENQGISYESHNK